MVTLVLGDVEAIGGTIALVEEVQLRPLSSPR
jgi:hypothetical protein